MHGATLVTAPNEEQKQSFCEQMVLGSSVSCCTDIVALEETSSKFTVNVIETTLRCPSSEINFPNCTKKLCFGLEQKKYIYIYVCGFLSPDTKTAT